MVCGGGLVLYYGVLHCSDHTYLWNMGNVSSASALYTKYTYGKLDPSVQIHKVNIHISFEYFSVSAWWLSFLLQSGRSFSKTNQLRKTEHCKPGNCGKWGHLRKAGLPLSLWSAYSRVHSNRLSYSPLHPLRAWKIPKDQELILKTNKNICLTILLWQKVI